MIDMEKFGDFYLKDTKKKKKKNSMGEIYLRMLKIWSGKFCASLLLRAGS